MRKILLGTILASMLISNSLIQATAQDVDLETRTASIELNGVTVEFEETLHECEQGYSLWYSAELLKEAELGGYECFIPVAEEDALDSSVVFLLVVEDDEDTVVGLEETLASYESSGEPYYNLEVGEIETTTLENGLVVDTAQVIYNDTADYFYLLKDETAENVLYITATMPADEQDTYAVWFDRMIETIEFAEGTLSSVDFSQALQQCSLCEEYKECGEYTVDGQTYLVCDNDYAEFAYAFGLNNEATQVCSLCEVAKPCGEYTVDGQTYLVCDDDYAEFAYAFGLNGEATQVCSLCQVAKPCGEYTVDGQTYLVCDNDYAEFAYAFGLNGEATQVCSLCQVAKPCGEYTVDGQTYLVCDNDYAEFAYAFGLNDSAASQVCSLCEVAKECGTYEADGQYYDVCDNCYGEFAYAFGLN